jgi:hypothetical protein
MLDFTWAEGAILPARKGYFGHVARSQTGFYDRVMSEFTKALLIANIYRYLLIVAGVAFAYMGYRLFVLGYFEKAGEFRAASGGKHILLKQVAPGVFFALFGVAAISIGVFRGIEINVPGSGWGKMSYTPHNSPCGDRSSELEPKGNDPLK